MGDPSDCSTCSSTEREASLFTALMGHDARVNQQGRRGNTLLHYVTIIGHVKAAEALMAANADCNIMNYESRTPIHFLVDNGNTIIINYKVGIQPIDLDVTDGDKCGPFMYALKRG
jgi:hypothetical protein